MKIKKGFVVRKVGGDTVAVPVGEMSKKFRGMINLNVTGAFLWNFYTSEHTVDEGVAALTAEYDVAEEILATANISGGNVPKGIMWSSETEDVKLSVQEINECIKFSLDELCEKVDNFFAVRYRGKVDMLFTVNPISITGEGIGRIKGAAEHISKRLNHLTEIVSPDLPYYDKPTFSSRIGLLHTATGDAKKGIVRRLFGGKRK